MNSPEGDKRWLAVLSTDMEGFTRHSATLGPERMYDLLGLVLGYARASIEAHGGHVVDTAGDGIMATFGAPSALENASLESCRAALSFHERLLRDAPMLEQRFGVAPRFRTGIAGGNAMVAHLEDGSIKVVGEPVNAAARLQALANAHEVLLSENIRRETEGFVRTDDRGMETIKGFAEPVQIHRLDSIVPTTTKFEGQRRRGLVKLVSRQDELRAALDTLDPAAPPRTVIISGPPGIGKSRLTHEIAMAQPDGRPVYIGQCAPTGQTAAYGPVLDILRQAGESDIGTARADIFARLFARHPALADTTAAAAFLEAERQDRDQTERALGHRSFLTNLLRGIRRAEGCVFVIEDVHWIDTATNGLLSALAPDPLPLVATCRPGFRADWFDNGPLRLDLAPLDTLDIHALVDAILGTKATDRLRTFIADKAEGNPLMAEELVRALRQNEKLTELEHGIDLLDSDGPVLTGNLEQLVLARVDKLSPDQKTALHYAAAIGRDFSSDLLAAALGRDIDLTEIAKVPGLIEPAGTGQWRFGHALIRDAVYGSLLSGQRTQAHLAIAEAIGAIGGPLADNSGLLAEHFLQSSAPERAAPVLVRAAEQSLSVYALYEADHRLEQALGFIETDPDLVDEDTYQRLAVTWLRALDQIGDFGRVERVSARVLPRLERQGYSIALSIVRTLTSIAKTHSRDYRGAEDLALRTLADAEAQDDSWGAAWSKIALMRIYEETAWQGLETAERLAAEIEPVAEETGDVQLGMNALYLLSACHRSIGSHAAAMAVADRIEAYWDRHKDRRAKAYAGWCRGILYIVQGDPERAHAAISQTRDNVVAGAADDRVTACILAATEIYFEPPDLVRPRIEQLHSEALGLRDYNLVHSMEWARVVLEIRAGNLALGWRMLGEYLQAVERAGHMSMYRQGLLTRAEIALAISGLIDPAAETPSDRPAPPRKRPGLSDFATYLSIKLSGKSQAERDLDRALALNTSRQGPHVARCQIGLGLIAAARRRNAKAREYLEQGLATIAEQDFQILEARARTALERL